MTTPVNSPIYRVFELLSLAVIMVNDKKSFLFSSEVLRFHNEIEKLEQKAHAVQQAERKALDTRASRESLVASVNSLMSSVIAL